MLKMDHPAPHENPAPVEGVSVTSIEDLRSELEAAMMEARFGRTLLLQTLRHFGFEHIGNASINEDMVSFFRDPTGDFAFGLVEGFLVPGKNSLASAGVSEIEGRTTHVVLLPSPSAELMSDMIEISLVQSEAHARTILDRLRPLSRDGITEIVNHEMTHTDDYLFAIWGQTSFTRQLVASGHQRIQLSKSMAARVLSYVPSAEEGQAATLIMELKAFCSNQLTDPSRYSVATECCAAIEEFLSNSADSDNAIKEQLQTWQRCLSGEENTYAVQSPEAVEVAARWLKQEGTLYPEKRSRI